MITIVDYGVGNLGSIVNMFKKIGVQAQVTGDVLQIEKAEKLLLPGVGAFDAAMKRIENLQFKTVLNHCALEKKIPILGICLGMQLMTHGSEEGEETGLSWLDAYTYKFKQDADHELKIPHMGWNHVESTKTSPLTKDFNELYKFYFSHSYFVKCNNRNEVILTTHHGVTFDSAIQKENIFGTQFHPEKSHKYGMNIFRNFAAL